MNNYLKTANSWQMYLISGVIIFFVIIQSVIFLIKSLKEARKIGIEKNVLKKVISSSIVFSILPSIGILFGVIALSKALGVPVPWVRLSIVGALHYETLAADHALNIFGLNSIKSASENGQMNGEALSTVVLIMTLGIIWGLVFLLFFLKKINSKISKAGGKNPAVGNLVFASMFIGLSITYLSISIGMWTSIKNKSKSDPTAFAAFFVAMLSSAICNYIEKRFNQKWLKSFSMPISMFVGMAVAILIKYCMEKH